MCLPRWLPKRRGDTCESDLRPGPDVRQLVAAKCCGAFENTFGDTLLVGENGPGPKLVGKLAGTLKLVGGAGLDAGGRGACLAKGERPGGGSKGIGTLGKAAIGGAGGEGVLCRWSAAYDGGGGGKYSGQGNEVKGP